MSPEEIIASVLYRDGLILVINKPAGIPVHAGSGKLIPLDSFFEHLKFGLPRSPCLAHRLDKETSGCLILGRHPKALKKLGSLFVANKIDKTYWAIVRGAPLQDEGVIDLPLSPQSSHKHHWWMKADPEGKPALTLYQVLGKTQDLTWLALKPQTGRTHQLRVHCAAMGFPILGDPIYGDKNQDTSFSSLYLHAYSVEIPLYPSKPSLVITAPPPSHLSKLLEAMQEDKPLP
jgi:tRNA pseudouridine32 synthase/23S rRNA pseudouridine746 synthase